MDEVTRDNLDQIYCQLLTWNMYESSVIANTLKNAYYYPGVLTQNALKMEQNWKEIRWIDQIPYLYSHCDSQTFWMVAKVI